MTIRYNLQFEPEEVKNALRIFRETNMIGYIFPKNIRNYILPLVQIVNPNGMSPKMKFSTLIFSTFMGINRVGNVSEILKIYFYTYLRIFYFG